MSKDGYFGDFGSLEEERAAYNEYNKYRSGVTPDCVPCFTCSEPMYEVSDDPKNNLCDKCKEQKLTPTKHERN
jgi:hypothetical protein